MDSRARFGEIKCTDFELRTVVFTWLLEINERAEKYFTKQTQEVIGAIQSFVLESDANFHFIKQIWMAASVETSAASQMYSLLSILLSVPVME